MKMDKAIEMILSLGLLVGAGYLVVKYVIPSLTKTPGGGGSAQTTTDPCADGSCAADIWDEILGDTSSQSALRVVQQGEKEGLSTVGIGGSLLNSSKPTTAQTVYSSAMSQLMRMQQISMAQMTGGGGNSSLRQSQPMM